MRGFDGNDTYIVDVIADEIIETSSGGIADTVSSASISLNLASYAHVENATLTGALGLNLTGSAGNNTLTGNSGANSLTGGGGADTMIGGLGDDSYEVDNAGDVVTEISGEGFDIVSSLVSITAAQSANIEAIILLGTADLNAVGDSGGTQIRGNAGNNIIDGGAGSDTLRGFDGNDTYIVDVIADEIIETSSGGIADTVSSASISLNLASYAHVENATLTGALGLNLTGSAGNNTLTGNSGAKLPDRRRRCGHHDWR